MNSTQLYDEYIESMKNTISTFNNTVMKPFVESKGGVWDTGTMKDIQEAEDTSTATKDESYVPFSMKLLGFF